MRQLAVALMVVMVAGVGLVDAGTSAFARAACADTINGGSINGGLAVSDSAVCVLNGVTVHGGVTVSQHGGLFVNGSTIDGGVQVDTTPDPATSGTGVFWVCDSVVGGVTTHTTIDGGVQVTSAAVAQIGGVEPAPDHDMNPRPADGPALCGSGGTINGGVNISGVTKHVELNAAAVNGGANISNNHVSINTEVEGNTIHGDLICTNDVPGVSGNDGLNTVTGTKNCPGAPGA